MPQSWQAKKRPRSFFLSCSRYRNRRKGRCGEHQGEWEYLSHFFIREAYKSSLVRIGFLRRSVLLNSRNKMRA